MLLQRLVDRKLVWRAYIDGPTGTPKLHFEINVFGTKIAKELLRVMPNPEVWLDACVVRDETTKLGLTVVGAVS